MFPQFGYLLIAGFGAVIVAFWPRYLGRPLSATDAYTHVHAAAMAAWYGMLVAQPLLVRSGRRNLHQTVGRASYVLVPVVVASSILLAHQRFSTMDEQTFGQEAPFLFLPLSQAGLLAVAYGLAIRYRRVPSLHARFMIGSTLTFVDPVLGRLLFQFLPPLPHQLHYQAVTFGLCDLILIVLARRDWHHARAWWAFPVLLGLFVPVHAFWFAGWQSPAWLALSRWFRDLPLG